MKKIVIAALFVVFLTPAAFAKSEGSTFWSRESERSGVRMPSPPEVGRFMEKLNPITFFKRKQDEHNARKAAK